MNWILPSSILIVAAGAYVFRAKRKHSAQLDYIKHYQFHKAIREKVHKKHPHLNEEQFNLVFRALRDYFWMCSMSKNKLVAMPSQVVDDAWHEFILFTRSYDTFCRKALGRFLHHTPTEAMSAPTFAQEGIRRAWRLACAREGINPRSPDRLPLIFAIDAMLNIHDGFIYVLDCQDQASPASGQRYCASHIGCSSGCAGGSGVDADTDSGGFFDGLFDSSNSGSDCGSGCGGGCGGD